MTLKPIENEFTDRLLAQTNQREFPLNLALNGPLFDRLHPKIIWTELQADRQLLNEALPTTIPGWQHACFPHVDEARRHFPGIKKIFEGRVKDVYQFLKFSESEAILDASPLGAIVLSKNLTESSRGPESYQHTLPIWVTYALSPELWGEQGKWTRFHQRLHNLFHEANLSLSGDFPGYYPLKEKAEKLRDFGFLGSKLDNSYVLVIPWSFSLTALKKLEEIIRQEF